VINLNVLEGFVKDSGIEFHENLRNGLVADDTSRKDRQTDRQTDVST